jgi:hypothetical protein
MKYSFGMALAMAAMGCGQQSPEPVTKYAGLPDAVGEHRPHYILNANSNADETVILERDENLAFPVKLLAISNAAGHRRAILHLGSLYCAYDSTNSSEYQRIDGSCNTFNPDEAAYLSQGEELRLSIESVDNSNYTVVQANVEGALYE